MPVLSRRLRLLLLVAALPAGAALHLNAAPIWDAATGWHLEGGEITGLSGKDNQDALNRMNRARKAEERGSPRTAAKGYETVAKKYPNSVWAAEALFRAGKLRLKKELFSKSFDDFQLMLGRYPNSPRFTEAVEQQYTIATALMNGARRHYFGFIPGFTNRDRGITDGELMIANAPYSDFAPRVLMKIASTHARLGEDAEAIDALDRMINFYPQNALTPDAYLTIGKEHASLVDGPLYDQASTRQAITYFEDHLILYPNDPHSAEAEKGLDQMRTMLAQSKVKLADYYLKYRKNYKGARVFYNEAITTYPDSPIAAHARAQLDKVEALVKAQDDAAAKAKAEGKAPAKKKRFWFF